MFKVEIRPHSVYARRNKAAHHNPKLWHSWNELFESMPGVNEQQIAAPVRQLHCLGATICSGPLQLPEGHDCRVFDITGRVVEPKAMTRGIYFVEVDSRIVQKVIKVR